MVFERADGTWFLAISGKESLKLGDSFGRAKESLWALMAAERARKQEPD
jgi:hypothetical protein